MEQVAQAERAQLRFDVVAQHRVDRERVPLAGVPGRAWRRISATYSAAVAATCTVISPSMKRTMRRVSGWVHVPNQGAS